MIKTKNIKRKAVKSLMKRVFSKILYKINFSNKKGNQKLLGIDLLKVEMQKDLLFTTILRIEEIYLKLLEREDPNFIMDKKGEIIFLQCTKRCCEDFLTKQYGYKVTVELDTLKKALYTKTLLKDIELVFQIPFYVLVDPKSPIFRLTYYPIYNYASETLIEALIDNMILEISNCVVYFSIIKFSSLYTFRQTLYRSKFLSLRNFERFKNNLNWQLLTKNYIYRPVALYSNSYEIFFLRTNGIYGRTLYTNRSREVYSLSSFSLIPITAIELKDFLNCRFDEAVFFLSKGIRFTFVSIFGQIIGLIWRGIIEGLKK